jgi:N-formylglutamate deformylase
LTTDARPGPLPLLISVPHAGLALPQEVAALNLLTPAQIAHDGDEGAAAIYAALAPHVAHYVSAEVGRAFVDMNRAEDDLGKDGVVKTHTCWNEPVYRAPLPAETIEALLARWHRPYHEKLSALAGSDVVLGVDCHTMAATGPPIGPDVGKPRPEVCIGDGDGTCPRDWADGLLACFQRHFSGPVLLNQPFSGGHIVRAHAAELPWVMIELSRAPFASDAEKGRRVLAALTDWLGKGKVASG